MTKQVGQTFLSNTGSMRATILKVSPAGRIKFVAHRAATGEKLFSSCYTEKTFDVNFSSAE
jgi:hypothetical protein